MKLSWPGLRYPLRIVQLSDLHWGNGSRVPIQRAVASTLQLQPDLVVLTGDFVDDRGTGPAGLGEVLAPLRGGYAVYGDHDYGCDRPAVARELEQVGIRLLVNESVYLESGLFLAGCDDLEEGRPDYVKTLRGLPEAGLLLCHNPLVFQHLADDLPVTILAGHTHAAQIRIPFPWPQLVCSLHLGVPTVQGWFRRAELSLYVNRGVGVAGPPGLNRRVNCPPEIAVFDLVPDPLIPAWR